jgi:hypothetical protein
MAYDLADDQATESRALLLAARREVSPPTSHHHENGAAPVLVEPTRAGGAEGLAFRVRDFVDPAHD